MSVPGVDISCNRCDYHGSTIVVFGSFKYSIPHGTIALPRTLGWCSSCNSLAPIEDVSRDVRIKSLAHDLKDIQDQKKALIRKAPLLKRMFSSQQPDSESILELQEQAAWISSELSDPDVLSEYLGCSRKPRCLNCGSFEVCKFPQLPEGLNNFYDENRIKIPVGMKHPSCGGELLACTSLGRLNMRFKDRLYSLYGESID